MICTMRENHRIFFLLQAEYITLSTLKACTGRIAGVEDELIIRAFTKYVPDSLRQNISVKMVRP